MIPLWSLNTEAGRGALGSLTETHALKKVVCWTRSVRNRKVGTTG